MDTCDEVRVMWDAYLTSLPPDAPRPKGYITWHFSDNPETADALGALAQVGTKTATAGLLWESQANEEDLPRPGELSIVTNWDGRPLCIVETLEVKIVPFDAVDEAHARAEGEGDGSLAYWREVHRRVFGQACLGIGRRPAPDMPVVCERFRQVFPLTAGAAIAAAQDAQRL